MSSASAAAAARPEPVTRWSVVALLAGAVSINYIDRGIMPTAAPLVQDDLALTTGQLGILFSAFFWTYALLQIPAGWLAERFGALRILAVGLAIWASATMLVGAVHSFAALLALRLLLGVGESAAFPCMSKVLATSVPVRDLGRANGIIAFGYLFGPAVGVYLGGVLLLSYGWRTTFWVFGAFSLIWLLPWSRIRTPLPPSPQRALPQPPAARRSRRCCASAACGGRASPTSPRTTRSTSC